MQRHNSGNVPAAELFPLIILCGMDVSPWSPEEMVARLKRKAERLERSPSKCMLDGGVDQKTLRTILEGKSPTLRTLEGLARGFEFTLGQVLGIEPEIPEAARPICDPRLLRAAITILASVIEGPGSIWLTRTDMIGTLAYSAYQMWVSALKRDANALSNESAWDIIADKLKEELASAQEEKS